MSQALTACIPSYYGCIIFDFLNTQSGLLTLTSIVVAIIFFFYQQHRDNRNKERELKDRLERTCNTLLADLDSIEEAYGPTKYPKIGNNDGIDFTVVSVSVEGYQMVVSSGLFTYFDKTTQLELDNFYYHITL